MSFRVAVSCMMQETNTFNTIETTDVHFAHASGKEVYSHPRWSTGDDPTRGILNTLADQGVEVVPLEFYRALPGGPVNAETLDRILSGILSALKLVAPVDGVCLALHGSMYSTMDVDPEGSLLAGIREITGFDVPICAAFDMHAKLSPRLLSSIDGVVAYKTAPHVDEYDTGCRAAVMTIEALRRSKRPFTAVERIPLLVAGEKSETGMPPMSTVIRELLEMESGDDESGILAASVFLGFPWADTPHAGVSIALTSWPDAAEFAENEAKKIADRFWMLRNDFDFTTETRTLENATEVASAFIRSESPSQPVIISDSGDNPTAGASQNMSVVLRHVVETGLQSVLISAIADTEAYGRARAWHDEQGTENVLTGLRIGTVIHAVREPFVWDCRVRALCELDRANVAVLEAGGVTCLLSDRRVATYEPSLIFDCGIDPASFRVLFVKCGYQGPEYKHLASRSIVALTPGDSNEDLTGLPYKQTPRPIVPLDSLVGPRPVVQIF